MAPFGMFIRARPVVLSWRAVFLFMFASAKLAELSAQASDGRLRVLAGGGVSRLASVREERRAHNLVHQATELQPTILSLILVRGR